MRRLGVVLAVGLGLVSTPSVGQEKVDLELVLMADASGSIDSAEIAFQRRGYAAAITDPEIISAIQQGFDGRIAVTYVEWGSSVSQEVVVPWTVIDDQESAEAFADVLINTPRQAFGRNAIGSAIAAGQALIEDNAIEGHRRVIDISADSANSWSGVPILTARERALAADITINGLAILCGHLGCGGRPVAYDVERAFAESIIAGPGSFVVTVDSDTSFAEAVRKKLLLEIAGTTPGDLGPHLAGR